MAKGHADRHWAECQAAFDIFDCDGDGHITAVELATIIDHLGMSWDQSRLRQMIKDVDKNGNGTIEFDEFLEMMQQEQLRKDSEAELLAAFKVFDKRQQGYITYSTMKLILTRVGATPFNKDVDDLIRQVATGENGRINYKSVVKKLCQDTNNTKLQ